MSYTKINELDDSFLKELCDLQDKYISLCLPWKEIAKTTFLCAIMITFNNTPSTKEGLDHIKNTVVEITRNYQGFEGNI